MSEHDDHREPDTASKNSDVHQRDQAKEPVEQSEIPEAPLPAGDEEHAPDTPPSGGFNGKLESPEPQSPDEHGQPEPSDDFEGPKKAGRQPAPEPQPFQKPRTLKWLRLYVIPAIFSGAGANGWCTAITYFVVAVAAAALTVSTYSLFDAPNVTDDFVALHAAFKDEVSQHEAKKDGLVLSVSKISQEPSRFVLAVTFKSTNKDGGNVVHTLGEFHFRHEVNSPNRQEELIGAVLKIPSPQQPQNYEFTAREEMVFFRRRPPIVPCAFGTFELGFPASVHVFDKAAVYLFDYVNDKSDSFSDIYTSNEADEASIMNSLARAVRADQSLAGLPLELNLMRRLNGGIQWCTVLVFWMFLVHAAARLVVYRNLDSRLMAAPELKILREEHPRFDDHKAMECELVAKATAQDISKRTGLFGCWKCSSAYLQLFTTAVAAFRVSSDYKAVPEFMDSASSRVLDERSARHALMKYLLWAIPTVGFVGTVVGIGDALLETVNVDSLDLIEKAIAKSTVSSNIGVAFDTTLVALLLSLIGMLVYNFVIQQEDLVVTDAGNLVQKQLIRSGEAITQKEAERRVVVASEKLQTLLNRFEAASIGLDELNRSVGTTNDLLTNQRKQGRGLAWGVFLLLLAVLASVWLQRLWAPLVNSIQ